MKQLIAIPAIAIALGGCVITDDAPPNMQRIYWATVQACLFAPTAEAIIAIWDEEGRSVRAVETARAICAAVVAGAPVEGAPVPVVP